MYNMNIKYTSFNYPINLYGTRTTPEPPFAGRGEEDGTRLDAASRHTLSFPRVGGPVHDASPLERRLVFECVVLLVGSRSRPRRRPGSP